MYLPSLVHNLGVGLFTVETRGENFIKELHSLSLRLGSLLKPINGGCGKTFESSSLFWVMFQFW